MMESFEQDDSHQNTSTSSDSSSGVSRNEMRARILRSSVELSETERARREAEIWDEVERTAPRAVSTPAKEDPPTSPSKEFKKGHRKGTFSLGSLNLNSIALSPFDEIRSGAKKLNSTFRDVGKEVKLVLTQPKKVDDEDAFEGIDRVKVNSAAARSVASTKAASGWQLKKRRAHYWLMCFEIGFLVGVFEFINHEGLAQVQNGRIKIAKSFIADGTSTGMFLAWLIYTALAIAACMFGCALCVYVTPIAKGGGIAEVKAFLNGVKIPGLLNLKTCLVKLLSTMCSVGAGLAVGQEGPMIHIGSSLAYTCSQMKFKTFPKMRRAFAKFQNDRDARDFVASGAAAGVSAAFRSPIGATLFVIEEAASFWSHELIWRTFFCCMIAAWSTNFFIGGRDEGIEKLIDNPSHVVYRVALGKGFRLWELFAFVGMGLIGGLLGAALIKINIKLNAYRKRTYWRQNKYKFLELAVIAFVTASLSILGPLAFDCRQVTDDLVNLDNDKEDNADIEKQVFEPFRCNPASEYNPMASLSFANSEIALKHLYIRSNPKAFGGPTLFLYALFYYVLMTFTAGTWIAAGLLVPQLIGGAAIGRFYGYILYLIFPSIDPGVYALLGSSAFMSGVSRLTIALVVIMIEITNDLDALLPIMTVCMIAKWVADIFCESIYDEQLHAGGIPFLEPNPPKKAAIMSSKDAMIADTYHIPEDATVKELCDAMKDLDESHKNIPVVDTGDDGTKLYLKGSIPRSHLQILLQERAHERKELIDISAIPLRPGVLSFTPEELRMKVDLKPYTNVATFTVQEEFPLTLSYKIFRAQGLREMFVVNEHHELRGRITRTQLIMHDDHGHGHAAPAHSASGHGGAPHGTSGHGAEGHGTGRNVHISAGPVLQHVIDKEEEPHQVELEDSDQVIEMHNSERTLNDLSHPDDVQ